MNADHPTVADPFIASNTVAIRTMILENVLTELAKVFDDAGIDFLPMKGAWLIATGFIDNLPSRTMADLDILVRQEDYTRTIEHLYSLPQFKPADTISQPYDTALICSIYNATVMVEIHRTVHYPELLDIDTAVLFTSCMVRNRRCYIMPPSLALFVAIAHSLAHMEFFFKADIFDEMKLLTESGHASFGEVIRYADTFALAGYTCFILTWYSQTVKALTDVRLPAMVRTHASILTLRRCYRLPRIARIILLVLVFASHKIRFICLRLNRRYRSRG